MKHRQNIVGLVVIATLVGISAGIMMLFSTDAEADSLSRQQDEAISTVNEVEITVGEYQDRLRAERWYRAQEIRGFHAQAQIYSGQFEGGQDPFQQMINILLGEMFDSIGFGSRVLGDMELQIILEQEAEQRGIVIDKDAIFAQLDDFTSQMTGQSLTPTPTLRSSPTRPPTYPPVTTLTPTTSPDVTIRASLTPTITPTPLAPFQVEGTIVAFQEDLIANADLFDISMEALTEIFYFQALQAAMQDARFDELMESGEIRTQSLAATSRHILIAVPGSENRSTTTFDPTLCDSAEWEPYRQAAEEVLVRLENGETFEDLAAELSDDPGTANRGGFLPEVSDVDSVYIPAFAAAIHEAEIGEYFGPVCTVFGFHILQVLDKYWRDLSESEVQSVRRETFQVWTDELLRTATIERAEDWPQWIIDEPTLEALLGDLYDFDGNQFGR